MKQRLRFSSSKDVEVLAFDTNEINKIEWEGEDEFQYRDEMYDVVEKHQKGGLFLIRCIPDKKEKALLATYQKITQRNTSHSPAQASLIKLITTPFIVSVNECLNLPQKEIKTGFLISASHLPAKKGSAVKHPPKVC